MGLLISPALVKVIRDMVYIPANVRTADALQFLVESIVHVVSLPPGIFEVRPCLKTVQGNFSSGYFVCARTN